jgi:hypothetical protein
MGFEGRGNSVRGQDTSGCREEEVARDHRLTLYHTVRYNWRWVLLATVVTWLVPTAWGAFEVWKKLQE